MKTLLRMLVVAALMGAAWYVKEALGIPDVAALAVYTVILYYAGRLDHVSQQDEIDELRYQFESYRSESSIEIDALERRIDSLSRGVERNPFDELSHLLEKDSSG